MNIVKETNYPLLDRKQVEVDFPHDKQASPKNVDIKKTVAAAFKTPEDLVIIRHIYTTNGSANSKIIADIYGSNESLKKFEKNKKAKKKEAAAPKAAKK
jgi:ribosomal protein S24E